MTEKEAIKQLEYDIEMMVLNLTNRYQDTQMSEQELAKYNEQDDLSYRAKELAIDVLKKQIPIEPIEKADRFGDRILVCPKCSKPVYLRSRSFPKYCQFCGQRLSFEDKNKVV